LHANATPTRHTMSVVRRTLRPVFVLLLVFHAGVLAASPFLTCCSTASESMVEDEDCCKGMGPGQICPLHKHRRAAPHDQSGNTAPAGAALRCGCSATDPALLSLSLGLGELTPAVSSCVTLISNPVTSTAFDRLDRARSLDPPPPRL
jgi:hypothetical protein